jgi:hypothetical protein
VRPLAAQQFEDVIVDPRRGTTEVLQLMELRAHAVVEGHELAIRNGSLKRAEQRLDDVCKMRRLDLGVKEVSR